MPFRILKVFLSTEVGFYRQNNALSKKLGLSNYEYAFYTAIADNNSAVELMQKETLKQLAIILFKKVKANASIDWTIKESVRARLKVLIKRTLRKYGYPPDMEILATDNIIKQAEMIVPDFIADSVDCS